MRNSSRSSTIKNAGPGQCGSVGGALSCNQKVIGLIPSGHTPRLWVQSPQGTWERHLLDVSLPPIPSLNKINALRIKNAVFITSYCGLCVCPLLVRGHLK